MAEAPTQATEAAEVKRSGWFTTLLIPLVVGVVCGAIGFSVPLLFPAVLGVDKGNADVQQVEPGFVPFGEVVVNVNEGRMNRYLRLKITLQIPGGQQTSSEVAAAVEKKKAIMTSWLLGHLADMSMDDIRGAAGQNRLRREIHDQFNWILFPNGEGELEDVLFEEFNVQ